MKIVQTTLNVPLTTKKLNTKIEYLSKDKQEAEQYINDLEYSRKLNKSVLDMLRDANKKPDYLQNILESMERENTVFKKRLEMEREAKERAIRQCMEKEEQRIVQKNFYEARIAELEHRAQQLRKLMHEKEVSFAKIIERLSQYEEMEEQTLRAKLDNIDFTYEEGFTRRIISKLSGEKLKLQKEAAIAKRDLDQYKMERQKIKKALTSRMNFYRFRETLLNNDGKVSGMVEREEVPEQSNPSRDAEIQKTMEREFSNPSKLSKEIVKLIKKQKLANDILEREFKESVQLNEEIINWNKILSQGNKNMQARLKELRAKIIVMEEKLKQYEKHFAPIKKNKSEKQLSCKYINFIDENPRKVYVDLLAKQVAEISLMEARPNALQKSSSSHNIYFKDSDDEKEEVISEIIEF